VTDLTVVIPSWNTKRHLRACLESLKSALPPSSEVIVVDNGSRDGSPRMVADEFPHVRLVRNPHNLGFAAACNQGVALARGAYVLFLGSDTEVLGPAVRQMLAFLEANLRYGAVAPRLVGLDGSTQGGVLRFPGLLTPLLFGTPLEAAFPDNPEVRRYMARDFDYERDADVEHPPATCLLMRRRALRREKPLDERLRLCFTDADLCRRLWAAGWRIRYLAEPRVLHHGGASTAQLDDYAGEYHRDRLEYYRKHHGRAGGCWVKACVGLSVLEHFVLELYRRAEGWPEEPLQPLWQRFAGFLRA
jgi:hypothetical protein